ncbi:uncharacterized protein LOC114726963 [Neltuma alba]|uniref:uncharacterized protein LOC114726963 n=1 Tax=Neltuma alba TaxID=207710 RepID=UPI0010A3F151|nr:uncharacterized protein LOC114726963 [Prosopis alba]
MIDLDFHGPRFTWNRGNSQSRLDCVLVNDGWHATFPHAKNWVKLPNWTSSVSSFTEKLRQWDREVYGNINRKKDHLYRQLDDLNRKIAAIGWSEHLEKLRNELWMELEEILSQEEVMWIQFSRCKWYHHGDRNTRYFHSMASYRKRQNRIEALQLDSGEWSYDAAEIMNVGRIFF